MLALRGTSEVLSGPTPAGMGKSAVIIVMVTLSMYMAALVDLKTLITFKRRNTLYFWSLLITSWGILSHSFSIVLKNFVPRSSWAVYTAFSSFGWWGMVTGQSLVLYSRLHLFVRDQRVLRALLAMIIVDFCLFQIPATLQKFLSNGTSNALWLQVYHIFERIQLIVFTLQELIISIIYIRAAVKWFLPDDREGMRSTKHFLVYLNILCIALDIVIICEVSTRLWTFEEASQSLVYAIKLTLEFAVLNKVIDIHRLGPGGCTHCHRRLTSPRNFPSPASTSPNTPSTIVPSYTGLTQSKRVSAMRFFRESLWPAKRPRSVPPPPPYNRLEGKRASTNPVTIRIIEDIEIAPSTTVTTLSGQDVEAIRRSQILVADASSISTPRHGNIT